VLVQSANLDCDSSRDKEIRRSISIWLKLNLLRGVPDAHQILPDPLLVLIHRQIDLRKPKPLSNFNSPLLIA